MGIVALHALKRRRKEIERQMARGGDKRALRRALAHLEAASVLLAIKPAKPPRKRVARYILDAIRTAPGPLTTSELTSIVMAARAEAPNVRDAIRKRTEDALYEFRRRGVLECIDIGGRAKGWRIANGGQEKGLVGPDFQ